MTERQLLDEVLAHPDEDAPRLVYADWLLSQGDPRGTFIAEQCRLASLDELHPDWPGLYLRTERALLRHRAAWTEPLLGLLGGPSPLSPHELEFARGFPERVSLWGRGMPDLGPLQAHAPLRSMQISAQSEPALAFRGCVRAGLQGLRTTGAFPAGALEDLAPGELSPLEELALESSLLSEEGARQLVRLHSGERLRRLSIPRGDLHDGAIASLVEAGLLDRCEELDLSENPISRRGLRQIVDREVELPLSLKLFGTGKHGYALCELLRRRPLRSLEPDWVDVPDEHFLAALSSPAALGLRQLHLVRAFEHPSPGFAARLAEVPFEGLTRLSLSSGSVDARGLSLLLEAQPNLVSLTLVGRALAKGVLSALLSSPHTQRLVMLCLVDCALDPYDLLALARWPGVARLARLNLLHNPDPGPRFRRALLDAPSFDPVWVVPPEGDDEDLRERFGEAVG